MSANRPSAKSDREQPDGEPHSAVLLRLVERVNAALVAAHVARAGEALAVGLSVFFCARAASFAETTAVADAFDALPAAAFAAAAWWLERRPRALDVVRRIDAATARDGALVACWEAARERREPGSLVPLLAQRLDAAGARAAFARAAAATTPLVLALPCAAAAVYAYARTHEEPPVRNLLDARASAVSAADAVARAAARAPSPSPDRKSVV